MKPAARTVREHLAASGWFGAHYVGAGYVRAPGVLARADTRTGDLTAEGVLAVAERARRRSRRPALYTCGSPTPEAVAVAAEREVALFALGDGGVRPLGAAAASLLADGAAQGVSPAAATTRRTRTELDAGTILAWIFFGGIALLVTAGMIRKPDLPLVIVAAICDAGMAAAVTTALRPESRFARLAGPIAVIFVVLFKLAHSLYTAMH